MQPEPRAVARLAPRPGVQRLRLAVATHDVAALRLVVQQFVGMPPPDRHRTRAQQQHDLLFRVTGNTHREVADALPGAHARSGQRHTEPRSAVRRDERHAARVGTRVGPACGERFDLFREVQTPARNFGPARANGTLATPLARRLAMEAGLDISAIAGTGPHGRITGKDVETAIRFRPKASPSLARTETFDEMIGDIHRARPHDVAPVSTMRRTIAARLVESKATIPHFYLAAHVGTDRLMAVKDEINASAPKGADGVPAYRLSVNDFMIKALARALRSVPEANAIWSDSSILQFEHADVAVAVSVPKGLITPVIHAAEAKSLSAISNEMRGLAARAREGALQPEEYKGGTTTISNLGMHGVVEFSAIINPPQATILAVGAAVKRAIVIDDTVQIRPIMALTLSVDHRATSGAEGARLLGSIKRLLEQPVLLLA